MIWIGEGNPRIPKPTRERLFDPDEELFVSAVTAYEYADLHHRGRIPEVADFVGLQDQLDLRVIDFPGDLWVLASALPPIHRDPVDRMLIAHAMALSIPLVTADREIQRYPLETLW
ncbi:MAG: type II toxin-antitoxin system VapC family toxin [Sphingomonadaceae bacterium]